MDLTLMTKNKTQMDQKANLKLTSTFLHFPEETDPIKTLKAIVLLKNLRPQTKNLNGSPQQVLESKVLNKKNLK
jgi:hypothetical protein